MGRHSKPSTEGVTFTVLYGFWLGYLRCECRMLVEPRDIRGHVRDYHR